jgi:phosphoribosylcarboxyaminoimidazole (NCAIR) mutase
VNAGILAAQIVGLLDPEIQANVATRRENAAAEVEAGTIIKTSE